MRRRRIRNEADFTLSFLDAICCGFGAIVLLLVLTKIGEPKAMERTVADLKALVARLELELFDIRGETNVLVREMTTKQEQLSNERRQIARLQGDLSSIRGEFSTTQQLSEVQDIIEGRLLAAQQELSEEMKRLQALSGSYRRPIDAPVGGIPVDSEYIIFVIDTSGSMFQYSWTLVVKKMEEVLNVYPKVKGIQVMNDMGQYMFSRYANKWIPDTPGRRKAILERLSSWSVFSNSSPVEGLEMAIRSFVSEDKLISIYVFGDEFTGDSVQGVLDAVQRFNQRDRDGNLPVRIHAVGFPVMFTVGGISDRTGVRFATLMRELARHNGGAFVGLNHTEP